MDVGKIITRRNKKSEREYYLKNKTACIERAKKWAKDNSEKRKAISNLSSKRYYKKNKEKIRENHRLWISKNKKYIKEKRSETHMLNRELENTLHYNWYKTPSGIYSIIKQNAKRKNRDVMSKKSFIEWYLKEEKVCHYCGCKEGKRRLTIDRSNNLLGYVSGNIVLACYECNKVKGDILTHDEMVVVGRLVIAKRKLI